MISDVVPPTDDALFVLESCHSTWIFDTDADALPARPEGPGARRPRRHHGVAGLLRARGRPHLGVVRRAAEPRGHPPAPVVAPRRALPAVRRRTRRPSSRSTSCGARRWPEAGLEVPEQTHRAWRARPLHAVCPSPQRARPRSTVDGAVADEGRRGRPGRLSRAMSAPLPRCGALDLAFDVGPHQGLGVLAGSRRLGPRHDHEGHRPQRRRWCSAWPGSRPAAGRAAASCRRRSPGG